LSLIQPSVAGPARWLLSEILGVKPESPGFNKILIEPHLLDLDWAKGTVASPLGVISAEWKTTNSAIELRFNLPSGCQSATLVLPKGKKYSLDHKKIKQDKIEGEKAYFTVHYNNNLMEVILK
jgi:hypothetical protein